MNCKVCGREATEDIVGVGAYCSPECEAALREAEEEFARTATEDLPEIITPEDLDRHIVARAKRWEKDEEYSELPQSAGRSPRRRLV